jgi:BlaI family transcriptional regulator, penicillinase repressor
MDGLPSSDRGLGPRHSILDLAPLELECMSALWPLGEGTVRDIHQHLSRVRPRAYTTIMTIMDRLAQKGIVTRRKVGRAYRYQPNLSVEEARLSAVKKIVTGFFEGSAEALAAQLSTMGGADRSLASLVAQPFARPKEAPPAVQVPASTTAIDGPGAPEGESNPARLDETLL